MIDTTPAIATTRQQIDALVGEVLRSDLALTGKYPLLALDGRPGGSPSLPAGQTASGPAGLVQSLSLDLGNGRLETSVVAARPAAVLVKLSYHGRWRATVDGAPVTPQLVAPGLLAVPVPQGQHDVRVWYGPVSGGTYAGLFGLGLLALVGLAWLDRRGRRRSSAGAASRQPLLVGAERVDDLVVDEVVGAEVSDDEVVAGAAVVAGAVVVGAAAGTREASVGSSFTA